MLAQTLMRPRSSTCASKWRATWMLRMRRARASESSPRRCDLVHRSVTRIFTLCHPQKSLRRAVDRNLMRRRVKNIFRKHKALFPSRVDLVVLVNTSGAIRARPHGASLTRRVQHWRQSMLS